MGVPKTIGLSRPNDTNDLPWPDVSKGVGPISEALENLRVFRGAESNIDGVTSELEATG